MKDSATIVLYVPIIDVGPLFGKFAQIELSQLAVLRIGGQPYPNVPKEYAAVVLTTDTAASLVNDSLYGGELTPWNGFITSDDSMDEHSVNSLSE
jgi:hypothetical protein